MFNLPNNPKIVIINLTKIKEKNVSYEVIESIKDGLILPTKKESKTKVFNSPHVIVFSNFEPDCDKISLDRWNIKII